MNEVTLLETLHPDADAQSSFDRLVGIDNEKEHLLDELIALLDSERLSKWEKKHHPRGVALARRWKKSTPLVLLSGEVGCGKTALAGTIATPLSREIDRRVVCLETPSDLRGFGHVGELSARVTDGFVQARKRARAVGAGLLVIDEADDVATARAQNQAHHEDRAGLNVLIKQIDQLARSGDPLAVILITNRPEALDPAVRRRASLQLSFVRPNDAARAVVFSQLLAGTQITAKEIAHLVTASRREVPFSYSDLVDRLARAVLREAQRRDVAVSLELLADCLTHLEPTPLMESSRP